MRECQPDAPAAARPQHDPCPDADGVQLAGKGVDVSSPRQARNLDVDATVSLCARACRALVPRRLTAESCLAAVRILVFQRATLAGNTAGASAAAPRSHPHARTYATSFFCTQSNVVVYVHWYAMLECKLTRRVVKIAACESLADCVPLSEVAAYRDTGALGFQCSPPALAPQLEGLTCCQLRQALILITAGIGANVLTFHPFPKAT